MKSPFSHSPNNQKGMTLLEVMVALLIFALTGTAILKAAGDHLNNVGQIEAVTFASYVASNRLNQLQLDDTWPPKNNLKGSMEMADRTWYWQQKVTKTIDSTKAVSKKYLKPLILPRLSANGLNFHHTARDNHTPGCGSRL